MSRYWWVALGLLTGCAPEVDGEVATNISRILTPAAGNIRFDVTKVYLDARAKHGFELVALVDAQDDLGSLQCTVPPSSRAHDKVRLDLSGYPWVILGNASELSYTRDDERITIEVDGVPTSFCDTRGRRALSLGVLFDAKPRPHGWSGEGMHGFQVALPQGE